jgi:hypothetical protein
VKGRVDGGTVLRDTLQLAVLLSNQTGQRIVAKRLPAYYLGAPDNVGWVADPHPTPAMTARELSAVMSFIDRFLLGKTDVSTRQFDATMTPPAVFWKAPETR